MTLDQKQLAEFRETVWRYYAEHQRSLPWREPEAGGRFDPYKILVSELMLQQTQVNRVVPKYQQFIALFPDITSLAAASLGDVLRAWSGLGYNRRAKYLQLCAQAVVHTYGGVLPAEQAALVRLPGIGTNTAGAIRAYAFNQPAVFVETNIRTVVIYHFFSSTEPVSDRDILAVVQASLPRAQAEEPRYREWYWALMDYGTYLKGEVGSLLTSSKAYVKQAPFQGSRRQIRGQVLRALLDGPKSLTQLGQEIDDPRLAEVTASLVAEGLIVVHNQNYSLV